MNEGGSRACRVGVTEGHNPTTSHVTTFTKQEGAESFLSTATWRRCPSLQAATSTHVEVSALL